MNIEPFKNRLNLFSYLFFWIKVVFCFVFCLKDESLKASLPKLISNKKVIF